MDVPDEALNPTLPDDVVAFLDARRQARERVKPNVIMLLGSEIRLGDAIVSAQAGAEADAAEEEDIDRHISRWGRFERRWNGHAKFGPYTADMRLWEARKAAINLAIDREWFYGLDPLLRLELVKHEIERRVGERRLKLARRRLRQLAPQYHVDEITSLRAS